MLKLVEPKTQRSRRTIAIPAIVVEALRAHRTRQLQERLAAGAEWREAGFVFTTRLGTAWDGNNVSKRFKTVLRKAGLRDQRFHDLRHCCATLLLVQGVPARVVMETLGHSSIGITLDLYTHVVPQLKRDAADRMNDLLTAQGPV